MRRFKPGRFRDRTAPLADCSVFAWTSPCVADDVIHYDVRELGFVIFFGDSNVYSN